MIKFQLYLLQLENYEVKRYWRLLFKKGYFCSKQPLRKQLIWTTKAKLLLLISILFILAIFFLAYSSAGYWALFFLLLFFTMPPIYTIVLLVLAPFDYLAKQIVVKKGKHIIEYNKKLKIIGIAGSYGKTTMKEVLASVLSVKYKVKATPESVNTPVGITSWVTNNITKDTEIAIIEMGEHYRGDIRQLCSIFPPNIAVVTGINDAHLERMKSLGNITKTVFELAGDFNRDPLFVLNADDQNVMKNFQKYVGGRSVKFYGRNKISGCAILAEEFLEKELAWKFNFENNLDVTLPILGRYIGGTFSAAILIGRELGMSDTEIKIGASHIRPVNHRLEPIEGNGGVLVIDDSYNGNPDGAKEAIELLGLFKGRRKVFLTPGLVESGANVEKVHNQIGKQLADVADSVILIKNSVTNYIKKGLIENGFKGENIKFYDTADEAHAALGKILKQGDVILFQNDWGDQYL